MDILEIIKTATDKVEAQHDARLAALKVELAAGIGPLATRVNLLEQKRTGAALQQLEKAATPGPVAPRLALDNEAWDQLVAIHGEDTAADLLLKAATPNRDPATEASLWLETSDDEIARLYRSESTGPSMPTLADIEKREADRQSQLAYIEKRHGAQ